MPQISVRPGETLQALANRVFNGDVLRFTELLDLNPNLDVFGDLPQEVSIEIPDTAQLFNYARPQLSRITQSINGIAERLPPNFQGYAQSALSRLAEVNGILDRVEQVAGSAEERLRDYGEPTVLVNWLLGRR